jgi:hypothetical protein
LTVLKSSFDGLAVLQIPFIQQGAMETDSAKIGNRYRDQPHKHFGAKASHRPMNNPYAR